MERYVCPPWYECRCILGKPVSKTTMLSHRREANKKSAELGLGPFAWGPKLPAGTTEFHVFECLDSLIDHPSDHQNDANVPANKVHVSVSVSGKQLESLRHPNNLPHVPERPTSPEITQNPRQGIPGRQTRDHTSNNRPEDDNLDVSAGATSFINLRTTDSARGEDCLSSPSQWMNLDLAERAPCVQILTGEAGQISTNEDCSSESDGEDIRSADDEESRGENSLELGQNSEDYGANERRMHGAFERIPDLQPWLVQNRRWVDLFYKYALKETVMDEILHILGAPCKQWKTIMLNISKASGLIDKVQTYATCPGHMAFVPEHGLEECSATCTECGASSPDTVDFDTSYQYIPLVPRLREMIRNTETCRQLYEYRSSRDSQDGTLRDYYDGVAYQKLSDQLGGETKMKDDIFLLASTDGFSPYKNRNYDVWSVAAINFNLPPDQRYLPQNVLSIAFVPGPLQPKNLQSFLLPFVKELKDAANGIPMIFPDGYERLVRIHLIGFTGDQPAVCKTAGLVGHNGRMPCRDCNIHGFYSNHYYYPSKIKITPSQTRVLFNPRRLPLRSAPETLRSIATLRGKSGTERRELRTQLGIREGSVLFLLPTIQPYVSFPHDIMHTFYNIGNELLRVILGSFDDDFSITASQLSTLDGELKEWKWGISGQLGPKPKPLSKYKEWKAAEHKTFSISYALVLFDGYLPKQYLDGLCWFAEVVDICTRAEIESGDVDRLRNLCVKFFEHFERCYFQYRLDRVDMCKSVFHILLHLADSTKKLRAVDWCISVLVGGPYWVDNWEEQLTYSPCTVYD